MILMALDPATSQDDRDAALARLAALEARVGPIRRDPSAIIVPSTPRPEDAAARISALEVRAGIRGVHP